MLVYLMPKWKKDATQFTVGVNHNNIRGYQTSIPKPVMERLNFPDKVTFILKGKRVEIVSGSLKSKGNDEK
jgi:hypothetical protein